MSQENSSAKLKKGLNILIYFEKQKPLQNTLNKKD